MEWLTENWLWAIVLAAFVAVHFLHGMFGGHGGGQHHQHGEEEEDAPSGRFVDRDSSGHRH